jgi:hypothetical protein
MLATANHSDRTKVKEWRPQVGYDPRFADVLAFIFEVPAYSKLTERFACSGTPACLL